MVALLARAAQAVTRTLGPGPELRVGDMSLQGGGRIDGHGSHRAGRDADILYFARDRQNRPADIGALAFSRMGEGTLDGQSYRLDTERNWALVKALVTDAEVQVQWVFCSHGIKVLLLEEALASGEDLDLIRRAAYILHRPGNARPHDDHMHVRIFCSSEERAMGCTDVAPFWSWAGVDEKLPAVSAADSDILGAFAPEPRGAPQVASSPR